ncbi:hypothetical protein NKI39_15745 [Mesorhizobium sp. M0664]|uniref:hypothetical protein n=1 Tax=Mesorhizobium sp. M0664 TaxID=2956982 RepID=UPI003336664B
MQGTPLECEAHGVEATGARMHDLIFAELRCRNPTSNKTEDSTAFRIPAAIVTSRRAVFILERRTDEGADAIVDGRYVSFKPLVKTMRGTSR